MEPVSAVASVIAIICFAGKALTTISDLKEFCHHFSQDATQDFLHDLQVTANVLTDVQTLAEKTRQASSTLHIEYRAEALVIQVDDCARDLTDWLIIALRMKKVQVDRMGNYVKLQLFNRILAAISRSSRASARERLRWHRENINTTLALFGMHIKLANSGTLHHIDATVRKISLQMSDNAEGLSQKVTSVSSSLSNSVNSLHAQQNSMSEKLDTVTDLLQQVIRASQSKQGSIKSGDISDNKELNSTMAEGEEYNLNSYASYGQDGNTILKWPKHQHTTSTAVSDTNLGHPDEFVTLLCATKSLINCVHQIYHPLITEFLSTKHAFDTLELQFRCLNMGPLEDTWPSAYDREAGLHKIIQRKRAAALQLLSLQKKCVSEGLGDSLELLMSETGISEHDLNLWESLTMTGLINQEQFQLGELRGLDPDEERKDRLTRTNEWMLGVFKTSSHLIDLHRQIMDMEIRRHERTIALIRNKLGESSHSLDEGHWDEPYGSINETTRRTIVKFWFLDSAAMAKEEYASSHTPLSDSDATFQKLGEEEEGVESFVDEDIEESFVGEVAPSTTMSRETAPIVNLLSVNTREVEVDGMRLVLLHEWMTHDSPPDDNSHKLLTATQEAIIAYQQEPCHVGCS